MLDHTATNIVISGASLFGLWVLFHWPYTHYRRDLLQNRLFAYRQELFDMARAGDLPFDHPVYGLLRTTINGFIRVGPSLNLIGFIVLLCVMSEDDIRRIEQPESYSEKLERLSRDLPLEVRNRLSGIRMSINYAVFCHIVFTFLPLALIFWPLSLLFRLFRSRIVLKLERIDNAALEIGSGTSSIDPAYQAA